MKKLLNILILILVFVATSKAQFILDIKYKTELKSEPEYKTVDDIIHIGIRTKLEFKFFALSAPKDTLKNVLFEWSQGNFYAQNSRDQITSPDSVWSEPFEEEGLKNVLLKATNLDDGSYIYKMFPVRVIGDPTFDGTGAEKEQDSYCDGEKVNVIGVADPMQWDGKIGPAFAKEVKTEFSYESFTTLMVVNSRELDEKITDTLDLKSVCLNFEHSDINNVKISLSAPDGKEIMLKDFGESDELVIAGNPIINTTTKKGVPGRFCFSMDPTNNYDMSEGAKKGRVITPIDPDGAIFPEDLRQLIEAAYLPEESFEKLYNSPLSGFWILNVTGRERTNSDTTLHNGYVESWEMNWNEDKALEWEFSASYVVEDTSWRAAGAKEPFTGTADKVNNTVRTEVKVEGEGANKFDFIVLDQWGFRHKYDKTELVVTQPKFELTNKPDNLYVGLELEFTDLTDWGVHFDWNFNDGTTISDEVKSVFHTFKSGDGFGEDHKKKQEVQLTVTSESGCKASVTQEVELELYRIEDFEEKHHVNVFTPHGSAGVNDRFKFRGFGEMDYFKDVELYIFNRWGKRIWKSTSKSEIAEGWDGETNAGKIAPGRYYYFVKLQTLDGFWHEESYDFYIY